MKILHFHTKMGQGGVGSVVLQLVNTMCETDQVDLCLIRKPAKEDVFLSKVDPRVRIISFGMKTHFSISIFFRVWKFLYQNNYDIVQLHRDFFFYVFPILFFHNKFSIFYTFHTLAEYENTKWDKLAKLIPIKRQYFHKKWLKPIAISKAVQVSIRQFYGCDGTLIYNGIKKPFVTLSNDLIKQYRISSSTKVFLHAGRISAEKNQIALCCVFRQLISEGKDVVLLIAGGVNDKHIYEHLKSYFSDRIIYLGVQDNIPQWMAHCDAFCLPSHFEGMPMVLLEALSVGCVPICSPVGGIVNVVNDGDNGILSASSDESDYYVAIRRFLAMTPDAIQTMQKRCLESFAPYEIHHTVEGYLNAYREALEERKH